MGHTSPKQYRDKYGPAPGMERVAEEAERLQREERQGVTDALVDGFMREFGVNREQALEMARFDKL